MIKFLQLFPIFLILFSMAGHGAENTDDRQMHILASIPPLKYLADAIGGKYVETEVVLQADNDPHNGNPETVKLPEQGDKINIFFEIGLPYEEKIADDLKRNREASSINVTGGIFLRTIEENGKTYKDPHLWLSPALVKDIAHNIYLSLCSADPDHVKDFDSNYIDLLLALNDMENAVSANLMPCRGKYFIVSHPSLSYLADQFGMYQLSLEKNGKMKDAEELRYITALARRLKIDTILAQPQLDNAAAEAFAKSIGARVVMINPMEENIVDNLVLISKLVKESCR